MTDDGCDICFLCYETFEECVCGKCEGCGEPEYDCICDLFSELGER